MNLAALSQPLFRTDAGDFRFASPLFLAALVLVPLVVALAERRERTHGARLRLPTLGMAVRAFRGAAVRLRFVVPALRVLCLGALVVAMARPQFGRVERQSFSEGIDIMLVSDVSLSMQANDFYPNRLEASKQVMKEFVAGRKGDRVGLVIFGADAASLVPLTLDYGVLRNFIERIRFNVVDGNSTAIGMGLSTAIAKLKESTAKSKVVILLTDGENNAGRIAPLVAAEAAKALGIRVYTIGVGSESGRNMFGMMTEPGIDEKTLTKIAEETGGLYFRATDNEGLARIYAQIDKLEKSRVESTQFDNFNELAPYLLGLALALLALEIILRNTRFLKIP